MEYNYNIIQNFFEDLGYRRIYTRDFIDIALLEADCKPGILVCEYEKIDVRQLFEEVKFPFRILTDSPSYSETTDRNYIVSKSVDRLQNYPSINSYTDSDYSRGRFFGYPEEDVISYIQNIEKEDNNLLKDNDLYSHIDKNKPELKDNYYYFFIPSYISSEDRVKNKIERGKEFYKTLEEYNKNLENNILMKRLDSYLLFSAIRSIDKSDKNKANFLNGTTVEIEDHKRGKKIKVQNGDRETKDVSVGTGFSSYIMRKDVDEIYHVIHGPTM